MSTYSTSFFLSFVGTGSTTLFTSSPTDVTVLRDVEVFNGAGGANSLELGILVSGNVITFLSRQAVPTLTNAQWEGRLVMPKSAELIATASANYWHIAVSGYLLSG